MSLVAVSISSDYKKFRELCGFAYGRSKASPDSEQIEYAMTTQSYIRNSVSVEQIQDSSMIKTYSANKLFY